MTKTTLIWDLPTRLFHWALVAAVIYAWVSVEILEDMQQHFYAGYAVLTLLMFRIIWGFAGSYYSRFRRLWFSVSETLNYAKHLLTRSTDSTLDNPPATAHTKTQGYLGHNPLGSLSVIAILGVLLVQTGLGLFSTDDYIYGPLAGLVSTEMRNTLTELHHDNVNLIYLVLTLHMVAIAFYQFHKKTNLTLTMITGRKRGQPVKGVPTSSYWLALLALTVCAGIVFWLSTAYIELLPQDDFYY